MVKHINVVSYVFNGVLTVAVIGLIITLLVRSPCEKPSDNNSGGGGVTPTTPSSKAETSTTKDAAASGGVTQTTSDNKAETPIKKDAAASGGVTQTTSDNKAETPIKKDAAASGDVTPTSTNNKKDKSASIESNTTVVAKADNATVELTEALNRWKTEITSSTTGMDRISYEKCQDFVNEYIQYVNQTSKTNTAIADIKNFNNILDDVMNRTQIVANARKTIEIEGKNVTAKANADFVNAETEFKKAINVTTSSKGNEQTIERYQKLINTYTKCVNATRDTAEDVKKFNSNLQKLISAEEPVLVAIEKVSKAKEPEITTKMN